jgi:hypothetical protein
VRACMREKMTDHMFTAAILELWVIFIIVPEFVIKLYNKHIFLIR